MKMLIRNWNEINMNIFHNLVLVLGIFSVFVDAQRIAPGVPPQHYQTPPQYQQVPQQQYGQQQYQQAPIQQQQVPIQQQQVPVQHQVPGQQQVPVQQIPVQQQLPGQQQVPVQHQQPHHHDHGRQQQILNAANVVQEAQHIAEHMDVPMDTSKMTEQELQFHYFKMHDADNNNKLDGCELIKSLIHWHDGKEADSMNDEELAKFVDPLLQDIDLDHDGFITYIEYKKTQEVR
ncbi:uncharacterized protein isoform X2 [Leptinotarsa decemlineata]|uniref:uncharacterized protein isoform X2 n=1 Tax=Leptinotarsa decemlineata TaxID=7539 RepID=UPI003D30D634